MKNRPTISALIICGNAENIVKGCLDSLKWVDQIVVVFANSTDNSAKIVKQIAPWAITTKINDNYGKHFAKWRNKALALATSDWLVYIDTDERCTSQLKKEILTTIKKPEHNYYAIPRANHYLGKRVKYGGSYPDYIKRLFKRSALKKWQGTIHEEPIIEGDIGHLKSDLLHYTHTDLTSMLEKTIRWTEMEAKALHQANHPPVVWWRFPRMMMTTFFKRLIKQQMWRDGVVGWISVIFETFDTFIIYARLYQLQQQKK